jgi:hypothetical protein
LRFDHHKESALSHDKYVIEVDESERQAVTEVVVQLASDADFLSDFRASPREAVANRGMELSDAIIDILAEKAALLAEEVTPIAAAYFIVIVVKQ